MKKLLSYGLILTSLLAASACGWHLRGGIDTAGLDSLYISTGDPQSNFVATLGKALGSQQVTVADSLENARYHLVVADEKSTSRTASVTSTARTAEYLLIEEVQVMVLNTAGKTLLPETTIRAERLMDFDENQVIGKTEEVRLVQHELRQDLVRQLVDRLQRIQSGNES